MANKSIAFFFHCFIKNNNICNNKLVSYAIFVIVYDLLSPFGQFIDAISPKVAGPGFEVIGEPVFVVKFVEASQFSLPRIRVLIWMHNERKQ